MKKIRYRIDYIEWKLRWFIRRRIWSVTNKEAYSYFLYRTGAMFEYTNKLVWGNKLTYNEFMDHIVNYEKSIGF